jgi:hypothetical protein
MALTRGEQVKIWRCCFVALIVMGLFSGCSQSAPEPTNLLFNNPAELLAARARAKTGDSDLLPLLDALKAEAEVILSADVTYSVTNKPFIPPSGDKHDYMSMGPYWWPDTTKPDGLPYIRRDGQVNPERDLYDAIPMRTMDGEVTTLAVAYFHLGDERYAKHACHLIRTWFLEPETRMTPHMEYAQAIPGKVQGRGTGIIDARSLFRISESLALLEHSPHWTQEDHKALQTWYGEFLDWMLTSENGLDEEDSRNNHGTWYDVTAVNLALFTGQDDIARRILEAAPDYRIMSQIEADGRQPLELRRTRSYHYSVMNLKGFFALALMGEKLGINLLGSDTEHGLRAKAALDYLLAANKDEAAWPYQRLRGWEQWDSQALYVILHLAARYYDEPGYLDEIPALPDLDALSNWHSLYTTI